MQIKKEILLFCLILLFSLALLAAARLSKPTPPAKTCPQPLQSCKLLPDQNNTTPWNMLTERMTHFQIGIVTF
jgi:hypothetical protein